MTIGRLKGFYVDDWIASENLATKVASEYVTPNLDEKDIDDILDYGQNGKCIYKPNLD